MNQVSDPREMQPAAEAGCNGAALFISYDGLTDPLGGSQILPSVRSIAAHPRKMHVLSFEKPDRYAASGATLAAQLAQDGISWTPLMFSARYGKLGKAFDLLRMYIAGISLQVKHRFAIVHCRSYQAMQVGSLVKKLFGVRTLFDMRGLWVDDRVDGNLWPQDVLFYRFLYRFYKVLERRMLRSADHVIVLTNRALPEVARIGDISESNITVIPCCADFDLFKPLTAEERSLQRSTLGVGSNDSIVVSYLGSLGTVYLFEQMLSFFRRIHSAYPDSYFLLVTKDWSSHSQALLDSPEFSAIASRVVSRSASRTDVPSLVGCSDVMLSFRRATYSQIACSPTKLGEAFALSIPVISNVGVGDVDALTIELDGGAIVDLESEAGMAAVVADLPRIISGSAGLRERAKTSLDLGIASGKYKNVYEQLGE